MDAVGRLISFVPFYASLTPVQFHLPEVALCLVHEDWEESHGAIKHQIPTTNELGMPSFCIEHHSLMLSFLFVWRIQHLNVN